MLVFDLELARIGDGARARESYRESQQYLYSIGSYRVRESYRESQLCYSDAHCL